MLKILGIILGFIIMVLSVIGLIAEGEYVPEVPEDLNGICEQFKSEYKTIIDNYMNNAKQQPTF